MDTHMLYIKNVIKKLEDEVCLQRERFYKSTINKEREYRLLFKMQIELHNKYLMLEKYMKNDINV